MNEKRTDIFLSYTNKLAGIMKQNGNSINEINKEYYGRRKKKITRSNIFLKHQNQATI